jgi:uncharacterized protein (DUF885 family)
MSLIPTRRSRRILFPHLALGFVALALTLRGATPSPTSEFPAVLDRYYEELAALFPVDAAGSGDSDHRYDSIWQNDISAAHREQEAEFCSRYSDALRRFDRAQLSGSEKLSFDTLKWNLDVRREGLAQPNHLLPINQFWGPALTFAQMGSGESLHPFKTLADYRHFIARAAGFSEWVDTAIQNMRQGIIRGIVQPRILMERVLDQYVPLMADDEEKNVFFAPLKHVPEEGTAEARESLRADYLRAVRGTILPAYARLHAFIKTEYLPHCRDTAGIGALPGGKEMYAYWVRYWTTTNRSPAEIHALGLSEVTRVRHEMERVMAEVGFKGSLPAFLDYVANDPKFAPFTSEEAVLDAYRQIEARLAPALPKFFGTIPKTKFEIRATEKFRAASSSAEYQPGSSDGARPGIFYVPILDPKLMRTTEMEDLFLHEAIPGHHFQISTALEKTDLPRFRRYGWNSAYGEGWALYSESLGKELGLYTDPYQYFGMLLDAMHRAVRLVVDTGIHAEGWSREQALQYSAEQEGGALETYVPEIERYMGAPGQALSYKIGQLKIIELRGYCQKQLGAAFDIRGFHDEILREGALPLAVLEAHIREWVASQRFSNGKSH